MDMFGLVERHALKVHALQPKPELEGAAQALPEDAKMDTDFFGWLQTTRASCCGFMCLEQLFKCLVT